MNNNKTTNPTWKVAAFLTVFPHTGMLGVQDYYLGNIGRGILKTCTANFFLIGWIYDILKIFNDEYKLPGGKCLRRYVSEPQVSSASSSDEDSRQATNETSAEVKKEIRERFDDAIAKQNEDDAMALGLLLRDEGEIIHVFLGFKKLAKAGFEESKVLYASLVLQAIRPCRMPSDNGELEMNPGILRMNINELVDAVNIARTMPDDNKNKEKWINQLQGELLCWNWMAMKFFKDNKDEYGKHFTAYQNLLSSIQHQEWAKEFLDFCSDATIVRQEKTAEPQESSVSKAEKPYLYIRIDRTVEGERLVLPPYPGEERPETEYNDYVDFEDGVIYKEWSDAPKEILGYYDTTPVQEDGLKGYRVFDSSKTRVIGRLCSEMINFRRLETQSRRYETIPDEDCLAMYDEKNGAIKIDDEHAWCFGKSFWLSTSVGFTHNCGGLTDAIGGAAAFVAYMFNYNHHCIFSDFFMMGYEEFDNKYPEKNPF